MEARSAAAFLLVVLAAAASSLVVLQERRRPAASANDQPFMVVRFQGSADRGMASVALMKHDLSLAGFANRSGHWHAFPGHDHILPGSTPLPFGNSYRDLIGGLANLPNLPMGRAATLQATDAVACYNPATVDDNDAEAVKRALATLTVVTSEGQRLQPISQALAKGWDSGDARVAAEHLPYIEHWDTICYELLRAHKNGEWDGPFTELLREHTNIKSKKEALSVVGAIANRTLQDLLMAHARTA